MVAGWWVAGAQCPVTAVLLVLAASSTLLTCSRSALTPRPGPPAPAAFSACPPPAPHTRVFAALAARTRTGVHTKYFLPLHFFYKKYFHIFVCDFLRVPAAMLGVFTLV